MANDRCATTSSSWMWTMMLRATALCGKNMHTVRSCYYALIVVVTKKTIGNCQGMLNVIQHALRIADFAVDYPALLEINHKIVVMGGCMLRIFLTFPLQTLFRFTDPFTRLNIS
jgi:hypothetical protein